VSLLPYQRLMYKDSFDVYREVTESSSGKCLGYELISSENPCQWHGTSNYDTHSSPAGQTKTENIMTANKLSMEFGIDVKPEDIVFIRLRTGNSFWQAVKGAPKLRPVLHFQAIYGVILGKPPKIIAT